MRTVFITSFHNFVSHFILASPFLELLASEPGLRVVLLVPAEKQDHFARWFRRPNVAVEGVRRRLTRRDALLADLAASAMLNVPSMRVRRRNRIGWVYRWTPWLLAWAPLFRRWYPAIYARFAPRGAFSALLERYHPDLIFSTDVFSPLDCRMMLEARDRGIAILGMVRSWDNLTTKGVFRVRPDLLAVNNYIIRREAIAIHAIPEDRIRVVGVPLYDRYDSGPRSSREAFSRRIGADPEKRLVLFAPTGDRFMAASTFDRDMVELLAGLMPPTHQLIVRFHPADASDLTGLAAVPNVIFDRPGVAMGRSPNSFKQNELAPEDDDHLVNSLYFSDLVISVSTTLIIDAAVLDKPQILIGFGSQDRAWQPGSHAQLHAYDHIGPVLSSGGVRIASSPDELREWIMRYLADPSLDAAGRERLRREQCWRLDGRSSQRLLEVLREALGRKP